MRVWAFHIKRYDNPGINELINYYCGNWVLVSAVQHWLGKRRVVGVDRILGKIGGCALRLFGSIWFCIWQAINYSLILTAISWYDGAIATMILTDICLSLFAHCGWSIDMSIYQFASILLDLLYLLLFLYQVLSILYLVHGPVTVPYGGYASNPVILHVCQ
jgi:hypothetical protein